MTPAESPSGGRTIDTVNGGAGSPPPRDRQAKEAARACAAVSYGNPKVMIVSVAITATYCLPFTS